MKRIGKELVLSLVLSVGLLFASGCSQKGSSSNATKSYAQRSATERETTQLENTSSESAFPEYVLELYNSFMTVINQSGLGITLGEITESSFSPDYYYFDIASSSVNIHYFKGECNGYNVNISEHDSTDVADEIITVAIAASEKMDYQDAKNEMEKITASFAGEGQSDALVLKNCRYLLSKYGNSSIDYLTLDILLREGEDDIDKIQYPDLNSNYMKDSLNKGRMGRLCGVVISETYEEYHNEVEIVNDQGVFLIFYNPVRFTGEMTIGETYMFYGQIAAPQDTYSGCLRIDYLEQAEPLDIDISDYPVKGPDEDNGTSEPENVAEKGIVYEDSNVVIKYLKIDSNGVHFDVENLTDKNITVQADSISVNGRSTYDVIMSCDVAPNSIGEVVAMCSVDYRSSVRSIGGQLRIVDFDNLSWTYEVTLDNIIVNDRIGEKTLEPTGVMVFENEQVRIYYKEVFSDGVIFEVENLTGKNLTIQADSLSINRRSISDIIMSCDIAPHSIGEVKAKCSPDYEGEVETISGQLRIVDMNTLDSQNAKFVDVDTTQTNVIEKTG